jgi:hypothetical protein
MEFYEAQPALEKAERKGVPWFIKITKSWGKGARPGKKFTEAQQEAFDFLSWDIKPEEFYATYQKLFMLGIMVGIVLAAVVFLAAPAMNLDMMIALLVAVVLVFVPIVISYYYLKYPQLAAEKEKMLSLAYIPEIVNYLVMSMRLVPNLEKAVEFSAAHGRGKIAEDFKKLVWDVQIGRFASIEEGLDELAYRWGNYSEEFKHALMLIRSSILETDARRRDELLERAVSDVLEASKEKMDLYARKLHQPTVYLYYFGILLPLLLAIVLPIGASLMRSEINFAKAEYVFILYNILIPIGVFIFGKNIVGGRPPTYVPPNIPENFPGVPKRSWFLLAAIVFLACIYAGYFMDQTQLSVVEEFRKEEFLKQTPHISYFYNEYAFFVGQFTIFGSVIGFALGASIHLLGKYRARKKIQDEIRKMEGEFKDAMYVLASRLGENRPIEDALRHAVEFLPKSKVAATVFRRILENIRNLGMTLDAAIFDPVFGALRYMPSQVIRGGMHILVDSVQLGVNVAARSLMNLAMQIRNAQKIDESLRKLLEDVTVMLKSMSTFVAPIVLAVVAGMQRLIITSLSSMAPVETASMPGVAGLGDVSGLSKMFSSDMAKNAAEPALFTLIMGVYVIEIVAILTYFNSQIEDTNNRLHTMVSIAYALPIAAILFCATAYFAGTMFAGAGG